MLEQWTFFDLISVMIAILWMYIVIALILDKISE